jgi:KaiC/GvpD/RAD55 family RecA-like ATPase
MKEHKIMEKCPTGIEGLDELMEGGFPRGRTILIEGDSGTGKSILSAQFIYNGILKYNEPGILIILEQNPELYKEDMLAIGFDLSKLEEEGKLIIIDASLSGLVSGELALLAIPKKGEFKIAPDQFSVELVEALIQEAARKIGAQRAVVDSFSALESILEAKKAREGEVPVDEARKTMLSINYKLQQMRLTSVLVSDLIDHKSGTHGTEKFMSDGIITLDYETKGADAGRHLTIRKMRMVSHSENIHQIVFERGVGVKVLPC